MNNNNANKWSNMESLNREGTRTKIYVNDEKYILLYENSRTQ